MSLCWRVPDAVRLSEEEFLAKYPKPHKRAPRSAMRIWRDRLRRLVHGVATWHLSNKQWQELTGSTRTRARLFKVKDTPAWRDADLALAGASRNIPGLEAARHHAHVYIQHWDALVDRALVDFTLCDGALFRFRKTQSAYAKVAKQIRSAVHAARGVQGEGREQLKLGDIVGLLWGAGSFGPTFRGHDSAPKKSLRKGLLPFFPIALVDEYLTSQRCARGCLNAGIKHGHGPTRRVQNEASTETTNGEPRRQRKAIRGLFHCTSCRTTWGQDPCSALNILQVFEHQRRTLDATRRTFLSRQQTLSARRRPASRPPIPGRSISSLQ